MCQSRVVAGSRLTGEGLYRQLTIDSRAGPGKFHEERLILGLILNTEPKFSRPAFKYMEAITSNEFRLRNLRSQPGDHFKAIIIKYQTTSIK